MNATLERADEITIEDLEAQIRAYQTFYGQDTDVVMGWIESNDPRIEQIEDAGFWRSDVELLERLRKRPNQPEIEQEDPNRVLRFLYAARLATICERYPGSGAYDKDYVRPRFQPALFDVAAADYRYALGGYFPARPCRPNCEGKL